ncbi:MAG: type II secretion system protein, partial [Candidatus Omnitrophica bacterium]|nr:type II secretion system protein [Candidatus Omnitrophota bacterium]
ISHNKKAMTLIEILIAIGILSIIVAATQQIFVMGDKTWQRDIELTQLQNEARRALDALTRELRGATGIVLGSEVTQEFDYNITINLTDEIEFDTLSKSGVHFYLADFSYNGGATDISQLIYDQTTDKSCAVSWDDDDCQVVGSYIETLYFCCWNGPIGNQTCNLSCDSSTPLQLAIRASKQYRGGDNIMYPIDDDPDDSSYFYLKSVLKPRNE